MAAAAGSLRPSVTTVQFGDITFQSFSTDFGVFTPYGEDGFMPLMGQTQFSIQVFVDMQDNVNLSFEKVKYLFEYSHSMTRDKVKDCKLTFWSDDGRQDALSTFAFRGWISHYHVMSGGGSNHLLIIKLQPEPGKNQYVDIKHGN